jgi:hypothetical protein
MKLEEWASMNESEITTRKLDLGVKRQARKQRQDFYPYSKHALDRLAKATHCAPLIVMNKIYQLWFRNFQKNPVELSSECLEPLGISRQSKSEALHLLESVGLISVKRRKNKSPLVSVTCR